LHARPETESRCRETIRSEASGLAHPELWGSTNASSARRRARRDHRYPVGQNRPSEQPPDGAPFLTGHLGERDRADGNQAVALQAPTHCRPQLSERTARHARRRRRSASPSCRRHYLARTRPTGTRAGPARRSRRSSATTGSCGAFRTRSSSSCRRPGRRQQHLQRLGLAGRVRAAQQHPATGELERLLVVLPYVEHPRPMQPEPLGRYLRRTCASAEAHVMDLPNLMWWICRQVSGSSAAPVTSSPQPRMKRRGS
jgi:hypothetical protein